MKIHCCKYCGILSLKTFFSSSFTLSYVVSYSIGCLFIYFVSSFALVHLEHFNQVEIGALQMLSIIYIIIIFLFCLSQPSVQTTRERAVQPKAQARVAPKASLELEATLKKEEEARRSQELHEKLLEQEIDEAASLAG